MALRRRRKTLGAGLFLLLAIAAAAALLVFSLLYSPCVAAVASIRRELGAKWAWGVVLWQCVVAWLAALLVRVVCILFGMG